jgi:predicted transposase YdaD
MALWLRFMTEVNEKLPALPPEMQANEHIRKAAELCEESALTPEQLALYDRYWDAIRSEKTIREAARREGKAEGRALGLEEGEVIGLEKGEVIGEYKKAVTVSKTLLKKGMNVCDVSDVTGLSIEEINKLNES